MKYHIAFLLLVSLNFALPMITGPFILLNETRMEQIGWLPPNETHKDTLSFEKQNPEELHFFYGVNS